MPDLSCTVAGITFQNPVIAASGTFGFGQEYAAFYDINRLGGISVKGLTLEPREGNPPPRIAETPSGILNSVGLQNPGVEAFLRDDLPYLKEHNTIIIANIAGSCEQDYCLMAERLSGSAVDMIELNISCPNVKEGGVGFGVLPKSVERITSAVRRACGKPLIVKLTPNVACIADNARAAEAGGADAISLINTLTGMAVDIKTRRPVLKNVTGGLSGPAVRPVALRMVFEAHRAVKLPVIGMGGICDYRDAVAFMLCGASLVQVGTANLANPMACAEIIEGLTRYLEQERIASAAELVGALQID